MCVCVCESVNMSVYVSMYLVEVWFEGDAGGEVRQSLLALTHGQVDRRPLEVGQIIRGVAIWRGGGDSI